MEEQLILFDEIEYQYVDGYKHRELLTEIGWEYNVKDGYYTTEKGVVDDTDILEECLVYTNNGVPGLTELLLAGMDDTSIILSYDYHETFEQLLIEVEGTIRGFKPHRMEYVRNYVNIISDLLRGEPTDLLNFAQDRMDRVEGYFRGEFYL